MERQALDSTYVVVSYVNTFKFDIRCAGLEESYNQNTMELLATLQFLSLWQLVFLVFSLHRYVRLVVNCYGHWRYRSKPKAENPKFTSRDVTVIMPTIESDMSQLQAPVSSILACNPATVILVTTTDKYAKVVEFALSFKDAKIEVYQSRIANKRLQLREAIPRSKTDITVLVDDDVTWPSTILPWLLAPFEEDEYGSVGVCQKVRRNPEASWTTRCWEWLGADYIERRNFEISATHWADGGTSCMSGRTNALRTSILQNPYFLEAFCNERWGKFHLNADDDNFITRWIVNRDIKTWIQYNDECMVETTLESNSTFIKQCLRWARSNWRSNYTTLWVDREVYWKQWYSIYAVYLATFTSLGLVTDPFFMFAYHKASQMWTPEARLNGWILVVLWYLSTKVVKRIGLIRRDPWDVVFIPVSIAFGFVHGFIKIYALLTWNVTSWGSRPDGDDNDNERMIPQVVPAEVMTNPSPDKKGLVRYVGEKPATHDTKEGRGSENMPNY